VLSRLKRRLDEVVYELRRKCRDRIVAAVLLLVGLSVAALGAALANTVGSLVFLLLTFKFEVNPVLFFLQIDLSFVEMSLSSRQLQRSQGVLVTIRSRLVRLASMFIRVPERDLFEFHLS
jgi:hypothetical protein